MATRSVLDIEVNDAQFKTFTANFEKYNKALTAQAAMWAKQGMEQSKIAAHFQKVATEALALNKTLNEAGEAGKKQLPTNRENSRLWTSMQRATKDVNANVKDATTSLLRWTGLLGIVSGLLGAGGLLGIDRMAHSIADQRVSGRRRGVSIGEQKAWKNFSRFGIDDSFLDTVAELEADPSSAVFSRFGMTGGGSTEENAIELMQKMRLEAQSANGAYGNLDKMTGMKFGANNWRALASGSDDEFNQTLKANKQDIMGLGMSDSTARAFTDFDRQMSRAGDELENVFAKGLVGLLGPLKELSQALIGLVGTIMGSQGLKDGIKQLGKWIDEFAASINDGSFQKSVRDFIDGVDNMAETMHNLLHPGSYSPFRQDSLPGKLLAGYRAKGTEYEGADPDWFGGGDASKGIFGGAGKYKLSSRDSRLGLPEGTISSLLGVPDLGFPGYEEAADKVYQDLYDREVKAARADSPNKRADALNGYAAANNIHIVINAPPGFDVNATVNAQ